MSKGISIIIPSYNGLELLKKCLPLVIEECKRYKDKTEIIVVDDGSTDNTKEKMPELFPEVNVIRNNLNEGFAKAANLGILQAKHSFIFLLNNDIEISSGIFENSVNCFSGNNVFAVQGKIISDLSEENQNYINVFYSKYGLYAYKYKKVDSGIKSPIEMDFASGGASMFRKEMLVSSNYFDERFSPVYFEDIDLCYRVKLFNRKILYNPQIKVYHRNPGETVKKRFSYFKRQLVHKQNFYLFVFKNIPSMNVFPLCVITMPAYVIYKLIMGDLWHVLGFITGMVKSVFQRAQKKLTARNILFVDTPLAYPGGGQISLLNIIKNLKSYYPFVLLDKPTKINEYLEAIGIPFNINRISKNNILFSLIRSIYLIKVIKPQVIHCNSATTFYSFIFALISRILKIPFIWHVRIIKSAGWKDKVIAKLSTKIIVISEEVRKKIAFIENKNKIIKIYNAVDTDKFKPDINVDYLFNDLKINRDAKIVGIISRLVPWKGHKLFFKSAKLVSEKLGNSVVFLIVGAGEEEYKSELANIAKKLNIEKNVVFTGYREDMPQIINICHIIVNPSIEPEPFGRTIIEAMSCEKAVISTDMGGPKEIIENSIDGYLVEPYAGAIASKIIELFSNEEMSDKIGKNARKKVKSLFSIEEQINKIEELYGGS
jgi:glycosyltransferase involved in cell wall biosynthesis